MKKKFEPLLEVFSVVAYDIDVTKLYITPHLLMCIQGYCFRFHMNLNIFEDVLADDHTLFLQIIFDLNPISYPI